MTDTAAPVIDIAPALAGDAAARRAAGRAIDAACRRTGFFCIVGHGVPAALVADMRVRSRRFFDLPLDVKQRWRAAPEPGAPGYIAQGQHALSYTLGERRPPDLNELFTVGPVDVPGDAALHEGPAGRWFVANRWPDLPPGLETVWSDYWRAMSRLGRQLLRLAALGLDLDEHWFDDKIDREISRLTVREYPVQAAEPLPGQLRAAAHTDFGAFTLLLPEDKPGGLQIRIGGQRDGHDAGWADIRPPSGAYVVNIGDMMARWTNDTWVSTLHRVVNPPAAGDPATRRQSLVFFQLPNHDASIACLPTCRDAARPPRYAPVDAGPYYLGKVEQMRSRKTRPAM